MVDHGHLLPHCNCRANICLLVGDTDAAVPNQYVGPEIIWRNRALSGLCEPLRLAARTAQGRQGPLCCVAPLSVVVLFRFKKRIMKKCYDEFARS